MSNLKPELSNKSKYHISKHRYYELKHFCLQYPEWRRAAYSISSVVRPKEGETRSNGLYGDKTAQAAELRELYLKKMKLVEQACIESDPDIYGALLKSVTEGYTYDELNARDRIPCSRDTWYDRYRKFFFILDKSHNLQLL